MTSSRPGLAPRFIGPLQRLAPLVALTFLTGCATAASNETGGNVRVVSVTPIESAAAVPDDGPTATRAGIEGHATTGTTSGPVVDSLQGEELAEAALDENVDGEEALGGASGNREMLENAIRWAREGIVHYREHRLQDAHKALDDARIALLEADLPEIMQEQGLAVLNCALGTEFAGVDLEAVAQEVALDPSVHGGEMKERDYIEREARRILRKFGAVQPSPQFLETFIDEVETYIAYYRGRGRGFFEKAYLRKHKYWPIIKSTFEAKGIPVEQGYMAFVESGFSPRAHSHADARGLWQFIPSTGRRYGLRRNSDFADVAKATEAASEYLLDLIGIFGSHSFLLATAAYNAGEGRIMRCLRDLEDPFADRSFWAIRPCVARETREYVPRILAAAVVSSDPKRFGFDLPSSAEMAERYDVVTIPEPTSLSSIARQAGVSVADLRTANTDLSSRATMTPARNFPIYLPKGGGQALISELSAAPDASASSTELSPADAEVLAPARDEPVNVRTPQENDSLRPAGRAVTVQARRGDTVQGIASRHGVSVSQLKQWNPFLKTRVLYRGDRLTVYSQTAPAAPSTTYKVRRGDTLSTIAERYGVGVRDLMRWNNLRSAHRLSIGQRLKIEGGSTGAEPRLTYTVQKGNSLQSIAQVFEVRYRSIMSWNDLSSSRLRVGQKLTIRPGRSFELKTHRVARGETVAKIARRYGVSVGSILTANGLTPRTVIRPGQRLKIYAG